jgi:hypothetical protein
MVLSGEARLPLACRAGPGPRDKDSLAEDRLSVAITWSQQPHILYMICNHDDGRVCPSSKPFVSVGPGGSGTAAPGPRQPRAPSLYTITTYTNTIRVDRHKKRETRRHCVGKTSSKAVRPPRYTTRHPCSCFLCPLYKTPTGSSRRPPGPVPVEAFKTARRIDAATILRCRSASPLRWQACSLYSINQERLNGLAILCIEKILLDEIDIDTIDFASKMLEETFKIIMIWIHYLIAY